MWWQERSSHRTLLGFELADPGTCWRPSPKKFWRVALALRELAFGRCRRTGTQINRALRHSISVFGLRRELYSVFQYAYQFVTHFEGRVGIVWAFVGQEFRIAWALLPFAKKVDSRDRGVQLITMRTRLLRKWELRLSLYRSQCSRVLVRFRKGLMRATSKPRGCFGRGGRSF